MEAQLPCRSAPAADCQLLGRSQAGSCPTPAQSPGARQATRNTAVTRPVHGKSYTAARQLSGLGSAVAVVLHRCNFHQAGQAGRAVPSTSHMHEQQWQSSSAVTHGTAGQESRRSLCKAASIKCEGGRGPRPCKHPPPAGQRSAAQVPAGAGGVDSVKAKQLACQSRMTRQVHGQGSHRMPRNLPTPCRHPQHTHPRPQSRQGNS